MKIRNLFYRTGIFKSHRLNAKVLSVGNITWGGTGKTSFVSVLAQGLSEKGFKVAILIRGYKRKGKKLTIIEPRPGDLDWRQVGDEAYLLASHLGSVPIAVGKNRVKSGREAINRYGADILVLDDGYQYRKLARDLDILMIDTQDPFGNGRLIPAGKLREPVGSVKRADLLVLNGAQKGHDKEGLVSKLRRYNPSAPIVETRYVVERIFRLENQKESILATQIRDKSVLGFCGIGNPESFHGTLKDLNVRILDFIVFPDHYPYKYRDIEKIEKQASTRKVDLVLTTEKDRIRLPAIKELEVPIYVVKVENRIISGERDLWNMIYAR